MIHVAARDLADVSHWHADEGVAQRSTAQPDVRPSTAAAR